MFSSDNLRKKTCCEITKFIMAAIKQCDKKVTETTRIACERMSGAKEKECR